MIAILGKGFSLALWAFYKPNQAKRMVILMGFNSLNDAERKRY